MMEHSIYSRHKGLLSTILISAASLYGLANSTPVHALTEQPIYPGPANSANYCMADAYVNSGGSGMKAIEGETLNCTANDVEITEVIPKAIIDDQGNESSDLTCTLGETFKLKADVRVRANAAERWDTTFYVPREENVDPYVYINNPDACSIILPVPVGTDDFDPLYLAAQQLDGDACGDIRKADLTNDEYTLVDAVFEIICEDDDPDGPTGPLLPDGQADFNYCAAWDNLERDNCNEDLGQVPNNKSKCKCEQFDIPVFIQPDPPTVLKEVDPSEGFEPQKLFKYTLTITKKPGADVNITDIVDIYRSSTSAADVDQSPVYAEFDLVRGLTNSNSPTGILNLLDTEDNPNTCKRVDPSSPVKLTTATPTYSCSFWIEITDGNLPDDPAPNSENNPKELYENFIRFSATDAEGRGVDVGNDTCDPTDSNPDNNLGNCSNIVTVAMVNKDPVVSISKTPVEGPGLRNVGGAWYVDNNGDITYEVVVTASSSNVDNVWFNSLTDDNVDILQSCDPQSGSGPMPVDQNTALSPGESFTCRFTVPVVFTAKTIDPETGEVLTYNSHTNRVDVYARDNEARKDEQPATATVTRAEPMIALVKDVAKSVSVSLPAPALNSPAFVQSINVFEPGDKVVYRFTITNANEVTKEALTLQYLTDTMLFDSAQATKSTDQRVDECDFSTTVAYGVPYVCTIVADVVGDASDDPSTPYDDTELINSASVTAKAPNGATVESNQDTAEVYFDNVLPQINTDFGFHATVFVKVTNTSTFEGIKLHKMFIRGVEIPNGAGDVNVFSESDPSALAFKMFDDSQTIAPNLLTQAFGEGIDLDYPYCKPADDTDAVEIAPQGIYRCFIRVQLFNAFGDLSTFEADKTGTDGGITVQVIDDDNTISSGQVSVKVQSY